MRKPVRPHDDAESEELEAEPEPLVARTLTRVSRQRRRKERLNLFLDDEFWVGVPENAFVGLHISVGDVLQPERQLDILEKVVYGDALQRAYDFIGYRARTRAQLAQKLLDEDYPEDVVERVMVRCDELMLLNDELWAGAACRDSARALRSRRQAAERLKQAGVEEEMAEAELNEVCGDGGEARIAAQLLGKRAKNGVTRATNQLRSRGFTSESINTAMQELGLEHEPRLRPEPKAKTTTSGTPTARPTGGFGGTKAKAAPDLEQLAAKLAKKYPGLQDQAQRRRALGWLARQGVGSADAFAMLDAARQG